MDTSSDGDSGSPVVDVRNVSVVLHQMSPQLVQQHQASNPGSPALDVQVGRVVDERGGLPGLLLLAGNISGREDGVDIVRRVAEQSLASGGGHSNGSK